MSKTELNVNVNEIGSYTRAYIPKKSDSEKAMLWLTLMQKHLAHFTKADEDGIGVPAYLLTYKGVGSRRTLQGIIYCKVDVGRIGKTYGDFWLQETLLRIGAPVKPIVPIRVKIDGDKIYKVI